MTWKKILKEMPLDKDPPMEYQDDNRQGFSESYIKLMKRLEYLKNNSDEFNSIVERLDEYVKENEMFGKDYRGAMKQLLDNTDEEIFYNLGYHTKKGREEIKQYGGTILLADEISAYESG